MMTALKVQAVILGLASLAGGGDGSHKPGDKDNGKGESHQPDDKREDGSRDHRDDGRDHEHHLKACIAIRHDGAFGAGHVGWGIELSPGRFMYGGLEGAGMLPAILPGLPNGGWYATGSWSDMLQALREPHRRNSRPAAAGGRYDAIKCTEVEHPRVERAEAEGRTMPSRGYAVAKGNCLDAANEVVTRFGAIAPPPSETWWPNTYYDQLPWHEERL